ncbi:2OG-Fe(II) oxygenase [Caenispirillum salinarum]|uniref:2OG-Fe(II) oxygenase n=1 Tax=Caenispirillum salinarum TaxID=859058 RepID=UPI00384EFDA1
MERVLPWGPPAAADPVDRLAPVRAEPRGWVAVPGVFSAEDCDRIVALRDRLAAEAAGLVNGVSTSAVRRSHIVWLDHDAPDTAWIAARLTRAVADVNRDVFGFALTGFDEEIQLTEYRAEVAGFYDWHSDIGGRGIPQSRKLSLTVQLSDPADYDGGALELNTRGEPEAAPRDRGTAIAFPSYALHRVAPVTRGIRRSLVVWTHGPRFV